MLAALNGVKSILYIKVGVPTANEGVCGGGRSKERWYWKVMLEVPALANVCQNERPFVEVAPDKGLYSDGRPSNKPLVRHLQIG